MLGAADRLSGYRQVLDENGIRVDLELIQIGGNTKESAYEIGMRLLALRRRPTAAVVCNNQMTLGLLKALRESKVTCPEAFSVIGRGLRAGLGRCRIWKNQSPRAPRAAAARNVTRVGKP